LAVPFEHFDGVLKLGDLKDKEIKKSNRSIEKLAKHIIESDELSPLYDTNSLLEHLEKGLYFDSNIPQGYGLGSSGALVAALYQQYRKPEKKKKTVSEIKNELSLVESYFHGRSSGLDPIVCYLNKAVLIRNGEVTETDELPKSKSPALKIFLINTHIERSTSPYVNLFLEKCKDKKFMDTVQKSLISTNDIAIDSFLNKKHAQLMKCVKLISHLHLDLMPEFIPDKFKDIWKQGLKFNEYHLKICGAGGGGFIIGFAKADARLDLLLSGYDIIEWMKF
jgi:mevalonate kinase